MARGAIELFYSYTREDETFLNKLNNHLASLKRLGLISTWHDREIRAGSVSEKEIDTRYVYGMLHHPQIASVIQRILNVICLISL